MKLYVFAIRDIKANAFLHTMYYRRKEEAERAFATSCNNPESEFFKYAEDFVLYELGEYDDTTGIHVSYDSPFPVVSATIASTKHKDYYAARNLQDVQVA